MRSSLGRQLGEGAILSVTSASGMNWSRRCVRVIAELTLRFWPTSLHNPAHANPSPAQSGSNPSPLQCSNWVRFVNPRAGRLDKRTAGRAARRRSMELNSPADPKA